MATIDFPSAPALGQTYNFDGRIWLWGGSGWIRAFNAGQIVSVFIGVAFVDVSDTALPAPINGNWTLLVHI